MHWAKAFDPVEGRTADFPSDEDLMIDDLVNIIPNNENHNDHLTETDNRPPVGKLFFQGKNCKAKKQQHGYERRVKTETMNPLSSHQRNHAALQAAARTLHVEVCPGWTSQSKSFQHV